MNKDTITKGLQGIGACWAVTSSKTILPDDGFEAKPSYHVHPDCSYPHQNHIKRFYSLEEIADYIKARKAAAAAKDETEAYEIMQDFEASRIYK